MATETLTIIFGQPALGAVGGHIISGGIDADIALDHLTVVGTNPTSDEDTATYLEFDAEHADKDQDARDADPTRAFPIAAAFAAMQDNPAVPDEIPGGFTIGATFVAVARTERPNGTVRLQWNDTGDGGFNVASVRAPVGDTWQRLELSSDSSSVTNLPSLWTALAAASSMMQATFGGDRVGHDWAPGSVDYVAYLALILSWEVEGRTMPPARLTQRADGRGPLGGPKRMDITWKSRQTGFRPGSVY